MGHETGGPGWIDRRIWSLRSRGASGLLLRRHPDSGEGLRRHILLESDDADCRGETSSANGGQKTSVVTRRIALRPPRNGTRPGLSATTVQFFHTRLSSLYHNEQTQDRQLVYPSHPFSTVLIITDIFLSFFVCIHSFRISFSPVQVLRRDKLVFKLFYISVICFPLAAAILTIYIMTCSTTQQYSTIGRNTIFSDQVGKLLQDQIIVR